MNSVLRDRRADVRTIGLELIGVERGGKHLHIVVRAPDGRVGTLIVSSSPSARNTQQKFRGDLRRFLHGGER
jgi:hypothetical protein